MATPGCYLMVGIVQGLIYPLINVYPLDLGATEAQQTTLMSLTSLPSCFKIVFGFLSDNLPIMGYRRKPYMVIGWMLSSLSLVLGLLLNPTTDLSSQLHTPFNTTLSDDSIENDSSNIPSRLSSSLPSAPPTMPQLFFVFFTWGMGVWLADVMGDSLVAERAKYESTSNRGTLQILCYIMRGIGFVVMTPVSSVVYSTWDYGPFWIISLTALFPLLLMPFVYALHETRYHHDLTEYDDSTMASKRSKPMPSSDSDDDTADTENIKVPLSSDSSTTQKPPPVRTPAATTRLLSTREQCQALWKTVCSRAVWQPVGFVSPIHWKREKLYGLFV